MGGSLCRGRRVRALKLGGYLRGGELESRVSRGLQEYPTLRVWRGASVNFRRDKLLAVRLFFASLEGGIGGHTTRSASIRTDSSLVSKCSSLHFPRGAAFRGFRFGGLDAGEDAGNDISRASYVATLAWSARGAVARLPKNCES